MVDFYLKVFLAVARVNSFTGAAKILNLSQPAVTHQIKNLENMFKTRLFTRDQNRIHLTRSGEILLKYAENISTMYQKAQQEILKLSQIVAGDVTFGAAALLGKYFLPKIIGDFKKKFHDVNLSMIVGNSKEILYALKSGVIELSIVSEPVTPKNLISFPFYRDHLTVIVYPGHPWARQKKISVAELFKADFISREIGSGTRECYNRALKSLRTGKDLKTVMVLGSTEAVKMGVIGEIGYSIVSRLATRLEIEQGLLVEVQLENLKMQRDFFVVFNSMENLTTQALTFIDYLKSRKDLTP